jgi:hypothetical protein
MFFDAFLSLKTEEAKRKAASLKMGWSKRETCLEFYKLVLQYLRALRGFNHRF